MEFSFRDTRSVEPGVVHQDTRSRRNSTHSNDPNVSNNEKKFEYTQNFFGDINISLFNQCYDDFIAQFTHTFQYCESTSTVS